MNKPTINYEEFSKVDMRIGKVVDVQPFPRARNPSYKVAVEFDGSLGIKWSSAQITTYSRESLMGKLLVCVVNMPPRNIAGFQSEILIMGAENSAGDVIVLQPEADTVVGGEVY